MVNPDFDVQSTEATAPGQPPTALGATAPTSMPSSDQALGPDRGLASTPMTKAQADHILAELKAIRQTLLWVLLLGGFFTARALFFHY